MVVTEGEGIIVDDSITWKENGKKQQRVYVHFWPKSGSLVYALEMDATTYKALFELRTSKTIPDPFNHRALSVKRGYVADGGETIKPPEGLTFVDLEVIARIRTMAEGTAFEEKANGFIADANGDTVMLVQIAEALAEKLALDGTPEVVTAAP